jgi:sugar transferase (PEP-CTERM system associated)
MSFAYPSMLPGNGSTLAGLIILTFTLLGWRTAYFWIVNQPFLRERVYVLGTGERAERLVRGLRTSSLGIEVVGWTGDVEGEISRQSMASHLLGLVRGKGVHRVIVAMPDRRGTLPVEELLELRLRGMKVEEATSWLERISGRIEVEQLYPSWLIFAEGFRFSIFFRLVRRVLNFSVALLGLVISLPLLPFIMLAVKLDSSGPVLYRQRRVGRLGKIFHCYKFRTMRQDAEADTGATWALDNDPRITRVGKFLRKSRLDEIPQLWCVLKGDMHFVGPRPERPEFVEWLSKAIPYYTVRHVVRPGITGWAQVQYKYGNIEEDAREKLQYDLFYIKNASLGLDLLIIFQTIKIVILGRGAK